MPPIKLIAIGITAAHAVWVERANLKLHKHVKELEEKNASLAQFTVAQLAQVTYLCNLLEEHEVPPTEFDLIALKAMMQDV